ncbi:MAG TPA: ABC transporter ATP-binding protein [Ktedonobacterales bacterium]|jgi:branched-chain amino acid transport system ATP-binding protein|nr:ABC transporter ATP-binding protein [Ktedonobacterales bacterium]
MTTTANDTAVNGAMWTARKTLLSVRGLTVQFGGLVAINALDLTVREGEIFALVGPNGAGKTTLLNCVSGFVRPSAGSLTFDGMDLLTRSRHARAALGIGRTFQNVQLFASMTVLDNLVAAQHAQLHASVWASLLPFGPAITEDRRARARGRELLALLGIERYAETVAGALPFGAQKLVGVARALALRPRLVLLDEPAAGMPQTEVAQFAASLRRWRDELAVTFVLIEHNMSLVQSVAETVCVLDYGRKLAEGTPAEALANPAVLEAYLGSAGAREVASAEG